ncbi:glycosyltransferase [Actinomyces faecalis]|uniref:glycosyltransferase n=1 Tax=Actinomyces faecalis TaxID=2722820 RepID=UPI001557A638|nr:glycosyltransferase [Actinomyces faecalis]
MSRPRIAIAHDYLTQRGGAERVVLAMHRAFPDAPIYTTLYDPEGTFPDFANADIRVSALNRLPLARKHFRATLPVLAPTASTFTVDADLTIASSTGWAHGFHFTGQSLVYCHSPARFLHLSRQYLGDVSPLSPQALALGILRPALLRWDRRAALRADRYLANSTIVAERIRRVYGIDADILFPPGGVDSQAPLAPIPQAQDWVTETDPRPFYLVVSRLMPYKKVDVVLEAFSRMPDRSLLVIGRGPEQERLSRLAPANARLVSGLDDAQVRWAYAHARALIAPAFEDFGLTPLEAYAFGTPVLARHGGGYLDTVANEVSGLFFERSTPQDVVGVVEQEAAISWDRQRITEHGRRFSEQRFTARLQAYVDGMLAA